MYSSAASISVCRGYQFVDVPGLERRMSRIGHQSKIRFGPHAVQIPSAGGRADDVVASLHDRRRDVANALHIVEQLRLAAQETAIHEVMAFDARHRESELVLAPLPDVVRVAI